MAVETSVSQTLTALELRSLLAQLVLETAVWEQMTASHIVLQETVLNALVSIIIHNFDGFFNLEVHMLYNYIFVL